MTITFTSYFSFVNTKSRFFLSNIYCVIASRLSQRTSTLTTVSKWAHRRFLQLIHVKGATVLDFNVVFPPTTIVWPMIANFTTHLTVCNWRMFSFDPSWGIRTTTTHRWTWSGHLLVTSNTSKAIPARGDISLITSDWVLSSERLEAVGCIEAPVAAAWVSSCNCSKQTKRCKQNFKTFPLCRISSMLQSIIQQMSKEKIISQENKLKWKKR